MTYLCWTKIHPGGCLVLRFSFCRPCPLMARIHFVHLSALLYIQFLTKGCETSEMTLRRNGLGQLGFHVNYEGIVAEVLVHSQWKCVSENCEAHSGRTLAYACFEKLLICSRKMFAGDEAAPGRWFASQHSNLLLSCNRCLHTFPFSDNLRFKFTFIFSDNEYFTKAMLYNLIV